MSSTAASSSYDTVARLRSGDTASQETPFRHFNNYVKRTLIQYSLDSRHSQSPSATGASILDLCSGRGGDIGKWLFTQSPALGAATAKLARNQVLKSTHYECYDVSPESIAEAQRRFDSYAMDGCSGTFAVADCFSAEFLLSVLPQSPYYGCFDVVSIQFALHYACGSRDSVRALLKAVSSSLAPGGIFIATTVDPRALSRRVREGRCANSLYNIEVHGTPCYEEGNDDGALVLGTQYNFTLDGFVDCPEFVVPLDFLLECATEYQLKVCTDMTQSFDSFLRDYKTDRRRNKGNVLSDAEVNLITLYMSLCFVKKETPIVV